MRNLNAEFNTEYKPRKAYTKNPFAFQKLDSNTVNVPIPKWIAGKRAHTIKPKNHRTIFCMICGMPSVWFDNRIKHQFNQCEQCDAIHEMILDNWGHVKKRVVDFFPTSYLDRRPYRIKMR